jgi:hypothetical protein
MRKVILWTIAIVAFFGLLIVISKPDRSLSENPKGGKLAAVQTAYDFGAISMKDGKVKHIYEIKNASDKPLIITKLYTSCMCTTVELTAGTEKAGPFSMQGHGGTIPDIEVPLQPGQTAQVKAVFDPAAHGSAGVGDIKRSVFVSSQDNTNFELTFKAKVRP